MRKLFMVFIFLTLLCSLAYGKTYKIGMIHWIAYSPLNVADVKGIWKKLGVDVQVINFGSNQELNNALEYKKIDIALDMLGSWVGMYLNGVPLTIIGETDWSHGGDKIIAKKDLDLAKLKGQTIGIYLNLPSVTYFLNKYLAANNINFADIKTIEVEPDGLAKNFVANKMHLIVDYDPSALEAERKGSGKVVATSATYEGVIPEGFVARKDVLKTIPETDLEKIFKGWIEAVEWTKTAKWDEYKKILNEKTFQGETPYSDSDLKGMLANVRIHDKATQLKRNKEGVVNYLKDLNDFLVKNKLSKKAFTPSDVLDTKVITKTLEK